MKLMDENTAGKGGPVGQRLGPNHFRAGPIQCWLWPLQQQKTAADFHLGRKAANQLGCVGEDLSRENSILTDFSIPSIVAVSLPFFEAQHENKSGL